MDINRNNYEEYFLLYADNELTDLEKVAVIMFLKENKDLKEEFSMIHHTISKADENIILHDKSFLFKNNSLSLINDKNYEEVFVLYHDNELTKDERNEVEQFLSKHDSLQNEFELIGLARLTPETEVIHPNKKLLYRKEKSGRVVPLVFWKMIAAAVFIGFGLWITTFFYQKKAIIPSSTSITAVPEKKIIPSVDKGLNSSKDSLNDAHLLTENSQPNNQAEWIAKERTKKPLKKKIGNIAAINTIPKKTPLLESSIALKPAKTKDDLVIESRKTNNIPEREIASIDKMNPEIQSTQKTIDKNSDKAKPVIHAQTVSYIPDEKENSQNYVFYNVTTEEFKRTKVGGFLKKVKRVIERTNPVGRLLSGEDQQVVSNQP
ncbi:MAG: hypothetical protein M3139_09500 [Bacteroidota bacterium]|nr:hypothetical protein [Bacteroidota bacterium]